MKIVDLRGSVAVGLMAAMVLTGSAPAWAYESGPREVLLQGVLGAGIGALSAEGSGGKAGTGALIGAGSQIIGGALLSLFTGSPDPARRTSYSQPVYQQPVYTQPAYTQSYQQPSVVTYEPQSYYTVPQQVVYASAAASPTDSSRKIIQQGLLGAGVGALSAEGSGGKAGTGALIGAGTQIVGGALMTLLTEPSSPAATYGAPVSYRAPSYRTAQPASKKIVRHYDTAGNLVSEEEFWA